ncbi:hypothetical protein PoB_002777300 [Plakobranchus ocellatus]|uniref:Uncharacterized protein n=1 Tax=Plakobranchus ocellatus TaxID=259542 RepID=A0AAV4A289_9GAST|nr:hypothetical protein PoB_002777300 [Plakobranchus ocellatus]
MLRFSEKKARWMQIQSLTFAKADRNVLYIKYNHDGEMHRMDLMRRQRISDKIDVDVQSVSLDIPTGTTQIKKDELVFLCQIKLILEVQSISDIDDGVSVGDEFSSKFVAAAATSFAGTLVLDVEKQWTGCLRLQLCECCRCEL